MALASKVLRQPALSEVLHHVKDAVQCTQNIQRDVMVIKNSVGLSTAPLNKTSQQGGRIATATWAQMAARLLREGPHAARSGGPRQKGPKGPDGTDQRSSDGMTKKGGSKGL
ncbi:hypothetical protein SBRCBS47491_001593 [Sporothrix bragantina]|uniref:Uncharacterized protein n=1 Tax=Sporothrix bragantina TaxID=671064 RepID=A0ABP0AZU9_9PEZI